MTHDPLCPNGDMTWLPETAICLTCHVIARVRKDERAAALDAAREAVTAFKPLLDVEKWNGGYDCCGCDTTYRLYEDALAAIDALREETK